MEYAIKFRPIRPASPHLNGKVRRSQRTDLEEFYPTVDLKAPDLSARLREWQDQCNHYRPHGSLGGRTPWEVWWERAKWTPLYEEVEAYTMRPRREFAIRPTRWICSGRRRAIVRSRA
jgi:transposase InsO family protein